MKAAFAIFQREFKSFFYSPVGFIILAIFTLLTGYFFYSSMAWFINTSFMSDMQAQQFRMQPRAFNVNEMLLRPFLGTIALISLFVLPVVTMRLYSDEKRTGTVELLYTTPITPTQIIAGKYLAGITFFFTLLIPTIIFHLVVFIAGDPEFWPIVSGYLGLFLMGSAFISAGLFISTTTDSQIIAAIGGFALSLILWIIGFGASMSGSLLSEILNYISIINHFDDFAKGVIDTSHIAYYVLFTFTGLFFSYKMVESAKWRA